MQRLITQVVVNDVVVESTTKLLSEEFTITEFKDILCDADTEVKLYLEFEDDD